MSIPARPSNRAAYIEANRERNRRAKIRENIKSVFVVIGACLLVLLAAALIIGLPLWVVGFMFFVLGDSLSQVLTTGPTPTNMAVLSAAVVLLIAVVASILRARPRR